MLTGLASSYEINNPPMVGFPEHDVLHVCAPIKDLVAPHLCLKGASDTN